MNNIVQFKSPGKLYINETTGKITAKSFRPLDSIREKLQLIWDLQEELARLSRKEETCVD